MTKPPYRVLLVDDEEPIRNVVGRILALAGYDVATAPDGPSALRLTEERPFDLFVLDVVMPEMRGDELAQHVRRMDPDAKILYFTGFSDRLFSEKNATLWEHEAFLEKPADAESLLEAVSLLLHGRIKPQ